MNTTSEVKERPILFSGEMVRAILDGRKTQTRRIVKPQPNFIESSGRWLWTPTGACTASREWWNYMDSISRCPYGQPGDRLWVRETWQAVHVHIDPETGHGDDITVADRIPGSDESGYWSVAWRESHPEMCREDRGFAWRPSIFMPRWASRITLEITGVQLERLQDITDANAMAEGVKSDEHLTPTQRFRDLWESINGIDSWGANPWVWVIQFRRMEVAG